MNFSIVIPLYNEEENIEILEVQNNKPKSTKDEYNNDFNYIQEVKAIESLSIQEKELELIKK